MNQFAFTFTPVTIVGTIEERFEAFHAANPRVYE